jgi:hypothetical protein
VVGKCVQDLSLSGNVLLLGLRSIKHSIGSVLHDMAIETGRGGVFVASTHTSV